MCFLILIATKSALRNHAKMKAEIMGLPESSVKGQGLRLSCSRVVRRQNRSEYITLRNGAGNALVWGRNIKTSGADQRGSVATTRSELTASQSVFVHFFKLFGIMQSKGYDRLMRNYRGSPMTKENLKRTYLAKTTKYLSLVEKRLDIQTTIRKYFFQQWP